jgi:hypothetical protein
MKSYLKSFASSKKNLTRTLTVLGLLSLSLIAVRGYSQSSGTGRSRVEIIPVEGAFSASGEMRALSLNDRELLGCSVSASTSTTQGPTLVVVCHARNQEGQTVTCSSTDPGMAQAVAGLTTHSYLSFIGAGSNPEELRCINIYISKGNSPPIALRRRIRMLLPRGME